MAMRISSRIRLNGWDKKQIPLPFGRITVICGEAFVPDKGGIDQAAVRLGAAMSVIPLEQ